MSIAQSMAHPGRRLVYIDFARAAMLFLGIPYHIAEAYRIGYHWYVTSAQTSLLLTILSGAIHSFRMPALFLLSGYFAVIVVNRKGARVWLLQRVTRLLVPLVLTAMTLGVCEVALVHHFRSGEGLASSFRAAMSLGPGGWIIHRWFLIILLAYSLLFALTYDFLRLNGSSSRWHAVLRSQSGLALVLGSAGLISALAGKLLGPIVGETMRFYAVAFIRYAPMFWLGCIVGRHPGDLDGILTPNRRSLLTGAASLALYVALFVPLMPTAIPAPVGVALGRYALPIFEPVAGWYVSIMFLSFMKRFAGRKFSHGLPTFGRLMVDNAMAIYLMHMVTVITATGLLGSLNWPPLAEFLVATAACSLVCAVTAKALAGNRIYELFFNGRRVPR